MVTAGDLVFYGDNNRAFIAADPRSGKPFWLFNASQLFKASPMTYMLDRRQYIGVAAGSTILTFGLP